MNSPAARLFQRQLADASQLGGGPCLNRLGDLVIGAYTEAENDRRRAQRTAQIMATEIEEINQTLEAAVSALKMQNLRFSAALENMGNGLALFGPDGDLIVSNCRQYEILAIDPSQAPPGCDLRQFLRASPLLSEQLIQERLCLDANGGGGELEQTLLDGRDIRVIVRPTEDGGFVMSYEDVTERNRSVARVAFLAYHDTLTELPNRVLLRQRLEQRLREGNCAVLCLDLDGFKAVNDTLGHPMGDALLREVTSRLCRQVRTGETLARLGGDEFAAVIAGGVPEATAVARRMIEVVSAQYALDGNIIHISTSIGIATAPDDGQSPEDLLRNADMALYRAKSEGRRCFRIFEDSMRIAINARRGLERDLRLALPADQLSLYYQPQIDIKTSEIAGFEALARWHHPERGCVGPDQFIPVAEECGVIVPLGNWVFRKACEDAMRWPGSLVVAVNVSTVQLRSPLLFDTVMQALEASGLPPERLELEVTETAMLNDSGTVLPTMRRLREIGVRLVLDDFGTGYSSLTHLQSFPFEGIKIDRSFVREVEREPKSLAIVRAVTGLGGGLGIPVIAEGVETSEQLAILAREHCDRAQGYFFGRPMPVNEVIPFLTSRRERSRMATGLSRTIPA